MFDYLFTCFSPEPISTRFSTNPNGGGALHLAYSACVRDVTHTHMVEKLARIQEPRLSRPAKPDLMT